MPSLIVRYSQQEGLLGVRMGFSCAVSYLSISDDKALHESPTTTKSSFVKSTPRNVRSLMKPAGGLAKKNDPQESSRSAKLTYIDWKEVFYPGNISLPVELRGSSRDDENLMDAFCTNTLSQTQCNGLTRTGFTAAVSVGIFQGSLGFFLAAYLALFCPTKESAVAWMLAVNGILFLITSSLDTASRFHQDNLTKFIMMEKVTAGLGLVALILLFSFHIVSVGNLVKRYDRKMAPVVSILLVPLAVIALVFNIIALRSISYDALPSGIRAGASNVANFLNPSTKALGSMLAFLGLAALSHILIHYLLARRKCLEKKKREERRKKAISSFSTSTVDDGNVNGTSELQSPLCRWFDTLIPSILLAIIKTALTFSSENTIIARKILGLFEYITYLLVVVSCLPSPQAEKVEHDNFFCRIASNPSYVRSTPSPQPLIPPEIPADHTSMRGAPRVGVGSYNSTSALLGRVKDTPRGSNAGLSAPKNQLNRTSYTGLSAVSSLAPEDSASTAAFLPRPPPPPPHLRTRTTHGPNGSELAPLREELLEKFNGAGAPS
ncbi:hypothetical protein VP01_506g5 [Puccinia sorghi]|uniref:Uncharacterized protein n=1 Tax=Puccinia sorghi TaxID=27349 RepID=A0A0L6UM91_9BASI|nr:hypothetical protein VP01_506g5 [Puccinia sorghi]